MTENTAAVERAARAPVGDETAMLHETMRRIEADYREMPGLNVTLPQAQRLWNIDYPTTIVVFRKLTERGIVRRTPGGQYIRGSAIES